MYTNVSGQCVTADFSTSFKSTNPEVLTLFHLVNFNDHPKNISELVN